jgi:hypothetical protein
VHPQVLIHIGYHKTGTSFLQDYVFDNTALGFKTALTSAQVAKTLINPHPFVFDAQAAQAEVYPLLCAIAEQQFHPVITREGLSGRLFYGGTESFEYLRRLYDVLPNARILIVIREQDSILLSTYNQFLRRGGRESLRSFLQNRDDVVRFDRIQFAYHHLIGAYQQRFGHDAVLVLPFESFRKAPADFVTRIITFSGCQPNAEAIAALPFQKRVNPSMPASMMEIKRWMNRVAARPNIVNPYPMIRYSKYASNRINALLSSPGQRFPARWNDAIKERQQRVIRQQIGDYYAESNAQTAALTGLDLAGYGYRLPSEQN